MAGLSAGVSDARELLWNMGNQMGKSPFVGKDFSPPLGAGRFPSGNFEIKHVPLFYNEETEAQGVMGTG